VNQQPNTRDN